MWRVGVVLGLAVLGRTGIDRRGWAVRLTAPVAFVTVTSLMASSATHAQRGRTMFLRLLLFVARAVRAHRSGKPG
jgi:hypothetical protein